MKDKTMHRSLFKRFFSAQSKDNLSNQLELSTKSSTTLFTVPSDALADSMQALEPRIMLDAAAVATATEAVADQVATEQAIAATTDAGDEVVPPVVRQSEALQDAIGMLGSVSNANEIIFIDSSVDNYHQILASINPSAAVVLLQADRDGLEQIADLLQTRQDIDSIHIISHGDAGQLYLGNSALTHESIRGEHADELLTIAAALSDSADILIYGCNFAEGELGEITAQALANATGADIAASDDLTGAANLGGDWDLEFATGSIEAEAISAEAFSGVLAAVPLAFTNAQFVDGATVPDIYGGTSDGDGTDFSVGDQFLFEDVDGGAAGGVDAVVTITEYTYIDSITGNDLSVGGTVLPSLQTIDDTANGIPEALQPILNAPPGLGQNEEFSVIFTVEYFSAGTANPLLVSSFVTPIDIDGNSAANSTRESVAVTAPVVSITQNDPTTLDTTLTRDNGETTITLVQPDSTNFNPGITPPLPLAGGTLAAGQFAATFEVQDATEFTIELKTLTGTNVATPNRFYSLVFDQVTFQNPVTLSIPLVDLDGNDSSGLSDLDYTNVNPYNLNDNVAGISIADTDISITDSDTALVNLQSATVNLTNTIGGDRLSVNAAMLLADYGIVATGDGTSSITLVGDSSIANYEAALASITYSTTDTVLNTTDRIIEVTVNNGDIDSPAATSIINILAAPTVNTGGEVNTAQPTVTGTFDEVNATNTGLQVSIDGTDYVLGVDPELTSDGNGNWILNLEGSVQTLAESSFNVVASNIDSMGAIIDSDNTANEVVVDFIAQPDTYSTSINNPLVIAFANAGVLQNDNDNSVLIVSEVNSVPFTGSGTAATTAGGSVVLNEDGTFTYTPLAGFSGVDTFTYTIADANGNVNAPVTVTIDVSAEIQAINDTVNANEDNILNVNAASGVLANDVDLTPGSSALNVTAITDPANNNTGVVGNPFLLDSGALVTLNMDGSYSYNPNGQFDTLASGESVADNFQYTVSDGVNTVTALVTVIVTGTDDAPVLTANPDNPVFAEDGSAVDVFDNVLIDTVEPGQTIENITFTVTNVTEGSDEILTIDGVEIPLVAGGPINTVNGYSVTVTVSGNDITVSLTTTGAAPNAIQTLVDELSYQNNNQGPTLTPRDISVTSISDSGSSTGANENTSAPLITSTVALTASNDPLDAIDNTYTTAININVTGNVITDDTGAGVDNDPDNTPITVDPEFTSTPANGSVVVSTDGSFIYTPDSGFEGTDTFTYRAVTPTTITGLNYELFDIVPAGFTVDNIPLTNPDFTGTATDFDVDALALPLTGSLNTFAIRYTGFINIETAGVYNFRTTSDDGSSLSIDGVELVDNDGLHSARTVTSAGTFLSAGPHLITVEFFENFGQESLVVEFSGPDTGGLGSFSNLSGSDALVTADMDTATVTINIENMAPLNTVPGMQTVAEDTLLAFTGINTISVNDIDGNLESTQLSVNDGVLNVDLAGTGATISAGANDSGSLTLSGTQTQINAALATLSYQGNLDFNGNDTLTVLSTDSAGTPLSDSDTVDITVNPVNDAPINTVPGAQTVLEDTALNITGIKC